MAAAPVAMYEPLRGEVWDVRFPAFGHQPAVVLSVNPPGGHIRHLSVIPITHSPGPTSTHVMLTGDISLTGHDESYADVSGLQPADRSHFRGRRGLLSSIDLAHLEDQLRVYLGL
jgi:mRNA interferase MazF